MVSIGDLLDKHDKETAEKPPLTKKEKQALKKLQKKLEKEAKIRKAEEDEMEREIRVAKKNIEAYRSKWKEIQMQKGRPEFKEYMTEHWCLFDHLMDRKDHLIELYTEELEHSEKTRGRSHFYHLRSVDSLLREFNVNIEELKATLVTEREKLLTRRNIRVNKFTTEADRVDENMRLILFLVDLKKKVDQEVWDGEMLTKLDEEISKNRSNIELLITQLERKLIALWKEHKTLLDDYTQESKIVMKMTEPLMEKVRAEEQMISAEKKKIKSLNRAIDIYRYRAQKQPMSVQLRDLRIERADLTEKYIKLKMRKSNWRDKYNDSLRHGVQTNKLVNDYLMKLEVKGLNIIRLSQMCEKLELEEEHVQTIKSEAYLRPYYSQEKSFTVKMLKFWKRVGYTSMVYGVLVAQHKKHKKTNRELKHQVKDLMRSPQIQSILTDIVKCTRNQL